jgi:hypothetical protein
MKLYTNSEQTAKLVELGFEEPKHTFTFKLIEYNDVKTDIDIPVSNYSMGELVSFLPQSMDFDDGKWALSIEADPFKVNGTWWVFYESSFYTESAELIDAIFAMIVKLKEK